ncbi:1-acyl-sn-glycerol-3-phosphate acyltransferase [Ferrovibrio sp.]|uniref:lysophospholipid acyltransferase family protein n=1 Tax=Ferrovibrio sp. TaxID=1917215 RepID=UPI000CB848FC|nr:lysophospholipid acyltransferase family protein [Ferrovibrio sp.]PJI41080.1 MAG: 1-acyl-sn-glycerol-3-phosphate acyltransferase [Ferrovibrio sp.]
MLLLRSVLFQIIFFAWSTPLALYGLIPMALGDRQQLFSIGAVWSDGINWLLRVICNIHVRIEGTEHIPPGPAMVAAKHQSLWDTAIVLRLFRGPAIVMKQELLSIPVYGALCRAQGMIAVDRAGGAKALKQMLKDARAAAEAGRKILIFPQGTRTLPGESAPYQPGVVALYRDLKLPVVPVALNSGFFWPKRGVLRRPGTIVLRFLPVIPAGLDRETFMAELETRIESANAALEAETRAALS